MQALNVKPAIFNLKNLLLQCLFFSFSVAIHSQTINISVDASQNRKNVSPAIYGKNNSLSDDPSSPLSSSDWLRLKDAGIKLFRENSGNNATNYNWRLKLTTHPDWYNNVFQTDWDFEANSLQQNIPGAQGMYAFQLIGKVASNTTHNFNDWEYNQAQWWPGVAQNLAGGGTVNPDWNATKALVEGNTDLYLKNWPADSTVGILDKWFGTAAGSLNLNKTAFQYWNMDNEPEIWEQTHDDVMPHQLSAEDFMQRYFAVAKKARAKFPEIKLVGAVPCSEWYWFAWNDGNGNSGKIASGGKSYTWIEYFIKRIGEEQNASGIRLLDVVDLHTYLDADNNAELLQLHRVFYDRTFDYPGANGVKLLAASGWDNNITKEYIFARINEWLNQYLGAGHGVTLGSTESGWNEGFNQMALALNYASTLGVFANEGVELFTPWHWSPSYWEVVHLYSRYSKNISVKSTSSDENNLSAYSTVNSNNDSLTVVLVNRYSSAKNVQVTVSNFDISNGSYQVLTLNNLPNNNSSETFVSHTTNALKPTTVNVTNESFSISLPALSISSVIIKGTSGPYLSVASASVNVAAAANSNSNISVLSNVSWTAFSDQTWLSLSPSNGTNNATIILTAEANTGVSARTATITISGSGVANQTITVSQVSATTGISNLNKEACKFYPNPANSILYFDTEAGNVLITIYDINGKIRLNKQIKNKQINIGNLPNGVYSIKIEDKTGTSIRKFVKE